MTPSATMLRTYLAHDLKKLRKRLRQVIEMKRKKMESIQ
jgi:hypothetical protein